MNEPGFYLLVALGATLCGLLALGVMAMIAALLEFVQARVDRRQQQRRAELIARRASLRAATQVAATVFAARQAMWDEITDQSQRGGSAQRW